MIKFFIAVVVVFALTVSWIFYSRFGFNLEVDLKTWVSTASYFNNILSPVFVFTTIILLYRTWSDNKSELEAIKEQNEKHYKSEMETQKSQAEQNEKHHKSEMETQKSKAEQDEKLHLQMLKVQETRNDKLQLREDSKAIFNAINPIIKNSIEKVHKMGRTSELCVQISAFTDDQPSFYIVRERNAKESSCDLHELMVTNLSYCLKDHSNHSSGNPIRYRRNLYIPINISSDTGGHFKLTSDSINLALKQKRKEKARKYKLLSKEPGVKNAHLERLCGYLWEKHNFEVRIAEHVAKCEISYSQYCQLRFTEWENFLRDADDIHIKSEGFFDAQNHIEVIAAYLKMLHDDSPEKQVLSKYVYHELGRYVIYAFLEQTFAKANSKYNNFKDYFKGAFDEIAKVLLRNEPEALYGVRLMVKRNEGIVKKISELEALLSR